MPLSGQRFEQLQAEGKRLAAEGRLKESLGKFLEAKKIMETPKILNRIQKLKVMIYILIFYFLITYYMYRWFIVCPGPLDFTNLMLN